MPVVSHYNVRRTLDIYGNVQGRDLGAVAAAINRIVAPDARGDDWKLAPGSVRLNGKTVSLPRGNFVRVRGQVETMNSSYIGLIGGLAFAIVLVYLLIVVNFQSWLDPFIIITALPAALAGIVLFLFAHWHHPLRARAHGCHHVHGRRHRQLHPRHLLRQEPL